MPDFVAPPLKGERADGDDVAVANPRAREHPVDAELLQTMDDLGQRLVVGEVSGIARRVPPPVRRRASSFVARAFDGDLIGDRPVHDDLVLEALDLVLTRLHDERGQLGDERSMPSPVIEEIVTTPSIS